MMKRLGCIFLVMSLLIAGSCSRSGRIIPRDTLAEIYADLLVVDQWVLSQQINDEVDSVMIYEPLLNRYGYTTLDYYASVHKYLEDPDRFAKILRKSKNILDDRMRRIADRNQAEREHREWLLVLDKLEYKYVPYCQRDACDSLLLEYVPGYENQELAEPVESTETVKLLKKFKR